MRVKINPLDKLFSQYIKMRAIALVGGCEKCLTPKYDIQKEDGSIYPAWKQLECSHFWGRGKKSVRCDEDNAAGLCFKCHQNFGAYPLEHTEWFKARLGDKFDLLRVRADTPGKPDKEALTIYLGIKIKELENET